MPTPNRPLSQNQYSQQDVINSSLDLDFGVPVSETVNFDGKNLQRQIAPAAGSATLMIRNNTQGSLSEALVLRFMVLKSVIA